MTDYEAGFDIMMPGMSKTSHFTITVRGATNPVEALAMAIEEWKRVTEPRDVRVKELQKVA